MAGEQAGLFTLTSSDQGRSLRLPTLKAVVTPAGSRALEAPLGLSPLVIGTGDDCDLVVVDSRVSRRHCELRVTERGVLLRDLGSKNGTLLRGVPLIEVLLPPGVAVTLGGSELVVRPAGAAAVLPLSTAPSFGEALGQSFVMRALFAKLERAAPTDEIVLLLGESGTGKEVLAQAIHAQSRRRGGPLVVLDCGAIAPSLVEGELFGHARGAFTGAVQAKAGLLEQANGGTLFIDELGELPLDLQPKLLRAIESKQVRRVGASEWQPFDARVVAATHRNLRSRVAEGAFRQDLYFRLAVVEVHVPALRERKDDIPLLVERFLAGRDPPRTLADLPPHALPLLQAYDWPGNVRELRNAVARLVLFPELLSELLGPSDASQAPGAEAAASASEAAGEASEAARLTGLLELPLPQAREAVMEQFERRYVTEKLRQHGGNISRAADAMGVSRQLVHRLLERYGMRAK
ncbi:MAG: sigma 54-interacting transcriptional regulator [Polyangiaceae bacterium]|jgi:transcriptional regulator with PAS, ATPase and Fis domain|nr:sigma 54-interacting transcriptional regulator [Polyangiaceae bacterium]